MVQSANDYCSPRMFPLRRSYFLSSTVEAEVTVVSSSVGKGVLPPVTCLHSPVPVTQPYSVTQMGLVLFLVVAIMTPWVLIRMLNLYCCCVMVLPCALARFVETDIVMN